MSDIESVRLIDEKNPSIEEIDQTFTVWSAENSGYDEQRPYIGLSTIADCPREIYNRYWNKTKASIDRRLLTLYSYEIQEALTRRLMRAFPWDFVPGEEISAYEGLIKGHTDGKLCGHPVEIKTIPLTVHLPQSVRQVPYRVITQINAYLHFGKFQDPCFLLYFARDSGAHIWIEIFRQPGFCRAIERKVEELILAVKTEKAPQCECRRKNGSAPHDI